jgi:hypothetical protein
LISSGFFQFLIFLHFQIDFSVVSHPYSVNVMDEHILKGNSAILKCHIPSFVSDFVVIDAWIDEESGDEFRYDAGGQLGTEHLFGSNLAFFCLIQLDFLLLSSIILCSLLSFLTNLTLKSFPNSLSYPWASRLAYKSPNPSSLDVKCMRKTVDSIEKFDGNFEDFRLS